MTLERRRRPGGDLTARAVFGTPGAAEDCGRLAPRAAACEDSAERVFGALRQAPEPSR
ncbi:Chromate resistance protein ChrB [Streptomyces sp. NPDC000658]|uniref:Chromate resistance protein ChrB n=1 Tax=Streptomyces sp. NPDC000658 TaxID=3154266 RepID=UPI003330D12E